MVSTMAPEMLGGLLVGTPLSGVVPVINAELLVAGAVVAAPQIGIPVLQQLRFHELPHPGRARRDDA